jgi:hypothetical protein
MAGGEVKPLAFDGLRLREHWSYDASLEWLHSSRTP